MKVVIEFECNNDAFKQWFEHEVSCLLSSASVALSDMRQAGIFEEIALRDTNGNTVGKVSVTL